MRYTFPTKQRLFAGAGVLALSLGAFAAPAHAQVEDEDTLPDCVDANNDGECDTAETPGDAPLIIVSGTRIARPNLDSPVPVTSVEAGELLDDGAISLGDALNDLPSLRSTFNTSNSQRFIGTTGLNFLDLRGLGTTRTLTLVNGRRHITSSAGDFQVDINTIPFELLERVDVVTGGSSAVYGSDAIAGVVNFILKRDYEGFELNGQGGISERGDNGRYSVSAAFGKNFADGRGNIAVVGEYSKIESVLNSQRPDISGFGIGFTSFVTVDSDTELSNSDGNPDQILIGGQRLDFLSEGGTVGTFCQGDPLIQPIACTADGAAARIRFDQNGRLFREENDVLSNGNAVGGTGSVLSDGTLIPDIERYNLNVLARFDISDAFRPYAEAKYARIEALGQGTPTFFNSFCNGLTGASGLNPACFTNLNSSPIFIRFDNAFLNPADVPTLIDIQDNLLAAFGIGPGNSQGFTLNRNNTDFGTRNDQITRETYRFVAGVEGDIAANTRYDVSFNYGRFTSNLRAQNQIIYQNVRNAVDAVAGPNGPVCRINVDANPNNDDAACVPLNIFGFGAPSQEALDYVLVDSTLDDKAEQYNALAYISSDSSSFFELPGGPVSVVIGTEWRRETAFSEPDALSASGATFFNAFDVFDPPALEVFEFFGELEVPILANVPGFEELTLSGAARYSDYNSGAGETGGVWAYNGNLIWSPIQDLRLRANYSRAVRSPTLSDLFSPSTENFLFLTDPCEEVNINNGTSTREQNCRADGVPAGYDDPVTGNRSVNQGGNPFLEAEVSDSWTIGAIFEPRFLPGFTASVDYYNIEVESVIANISANQILANCYDAPSLDNNFCPLIADREADGSLPLTGALNIAPINYANLTAEGIDFDLRYVKTFDNDDRLSFRVIATHVLDRTNFLDVDNPDLPNRVKGELGDPEWAFNFNASYTRGPVTLSYGMRWIDKQFIGAAENYVPYVTECVDDGTGAGVIPQTDTSCTIGELVTAPPANPDLTAEVNYPIRAYHDIRLDFRVNDRFNFYTGVDNLTDKLPPFALTGAGAGSGIFSNTGRFFFAGFNAEF
ncbi:TonB-dependent receptor [Qipengyuania sp. JC766]|uniref:TonB-dependent receptor domain-containing protein n=1 Tax=Qipengyuania sp. JC766 TaxID=3232139 RepID=UPI003457E857